MRTFVLTFLLAVGFGLVGGLPTWAQQPAPKDVTVFEMLKEEGQIEEIPAPILRQKAKRNPEALTPEQQQRARNYLRRQAAQSGFGKAVTQANGGFSGLEIKDALQRNGASRFPRGQLNVRPNAGPIPAGDVNGDGISDWIYKFFTADDRTADPTDTTPKTFLRFGGGDFSSDYFDELFYRDLIPAGNLVGSENADAIGLIGDGSEGFRIFRGSDQGYVEVATRSDSIPSQAISPADLDGDGHDDLLFGSPNNNEIVVIFGADDPGDVEVKSFAPPHDGSPSFSYTTGNLEEDTSSAELIRLAGGDRVGSEPMVVTVFDVNQAREFSVRQEFEVLRGGEPGRNIPSVASNVVMDLANVDREEDGTELLLRNPSGFPETEAQESFIFNFSGSFGTVPFQFPPDIRHVGDVNGDGRADFALRDTSSGDPFIAFGPPALDDGLSLDLSIADAGGTVSLNAIDDFQGFRDEDNRLGDLDGDGQDDLIVQRQAETEFGPRLVSVDTSGTGTETADVSFDAEAYNTSQVVQTVALGDWGGDESDDVAFLRSGFDAGANGGEGESVGSVEVYFGDPTTSIQPDLTLTHPDGAAPDLAVTGDFTGDGTQNLAVTYQDSSSTIEIYEAGGGDAPIQSIDYGDLAEGITSTSPDFAFANSIENVGDVNGDGTDDLLVGVPESENNSDTAFLFLGGSPLASQPDETVNLSGFPFSVFSGSNIEGIGDVNEDGVDDFAVGVGFESILVFFGDDASLDFSSEDLVISQSGITLFGLPMASGDFNGDGTPDLAVSSAFHENDSGEGTEAIRIYEGGPGFDGTPEHALFAPGPPLGAAPSFQNLTGTLGELTGLPDFNGDGSDELLLGTAFPTTNALIYAGNGTDKPEPSILLRAPDQSTGLGADNNNINNSNTFSAVGNFNSDDQVEVVLPQEDAAGFRGAPAYTYQPGAAPEEEEEPVASDTSSVDSEDFGTETSFETTGTSVALSESSDGEGDITVNRFESEPEGSGTVGQENVSEFRVEITASEGLSVGEGTEVRFSVDRLSGVSNPENVTIVTRDIPGVGDFTELETMVDQNETPDDPSDDELFATVDGFSEFAFASNTEPLFSVPAQVAAEASQSFGDASGPGDYRLVALPGQVDRALSATLEGEAGTEWQAYWDDGSDENPFQQFGGSETSETFDFRPGRGFWVVSTEGWSVSDTLETVSLTADQEVRIPLNGSSTWTIVSNPLDRDVAWRSVVAANDLAASGTAQPLWRFDGAEGFVRADTMESAAGGEAYYFFNAASLNSLAVPYPATKTKSRPVAKSKLAATTRSPSVPLLSVSAQPAGQEEPPSTVHVGLLKEEARSSVAPPGRFEPVSLRIQDLEAESPRAKELMAATRPSGSDGGHTFQLRLRSQVKGPVELSAEGLQETGIQAARLLRPSGGKTYDLFEEGKVTIRPEEIPEEGPAELKLAVGTESYVGQEAESVLPEEVTLKSYPNPVRRQGTLEYALPEASEVTLKVYDVLGRQVATLAQGQEKAGRHTVRLETGRLSSGVYFGRLEAGGQTRTQKITVVR